MPNKTILAIVGLAGAGKGEATKHISEKTGAPNVYFGEPTFERIKKEGLELNYTNEKLIREKIREELGMGAYAILSLPKVKDAIDANDLVTVESLYSWEEYKIMKREFGDAFKVLAVFASPDVRFKRLSERKQDIGKGEDRIRILKDRTEFETRDYSEIEKTDKGGPIARADFMVVNEGTLEEFHRQLDMAIYSVISSGARDL